MEPKVGYAIVPINFEYNDEFTYESNHNLPDEVYSCFHAAQARKAVLDARERADAELDDYWQDEEGNIPEEYYEIKEVKIYG